MVFIIKKSRIKQDRHQTNTKQTHNMHQKTVMRHTQGFQIRDVERKLNMVLNQNINEIHDLPIANKEWQLDVLQNTKTKDIDDFQMIVFEKHHIVCKTNR